MPRSDVLITQPRQNARSYAVLGYSEPPFQGSERYVTDIVKQALGCYCISVTVESNRIELDLFSIADTDEVDRIMLNRLGSYLDNKLTFVDCPAID